MPRWFTHACNPPNTARKIIWFTSVFSIPNGLPNAPTKKVHAPTFTDPNTVISPNKFNHAVNHPRDRLPNTDAQW